jgi:hypothetical protein
MSLVLLQMDPRRDEYVLALLHISFDRCVRVVSLRLGVPGSLLVYTLQGRSGRFVQSFKMLRDACK